MTDSNSGGVESRGVPKAQRPVQPGAKMASPAGAQQKFQLPAWPQKFDVQGPEVSSFGFAVTQPGPITVDVQAQGVPLLVTLRSPGGQPITQQATGGLRMSHNVTPQDVQRGVLWTVSLALPPNTQGRTTGHVTVQYPVVNEAQAEAAVRLRLDQAKQHGQVDPAQMQARRQALLEARRVQLERQYQDFVKGTELQLDAFLKQRQAQGKIRSRGFGQPGVLHETPTTPQMSAMPTGPHIDRLSVTQGPPGTTVIIEGSGFGSGPGFVHMTVNSTRELFANVVGAPAQPIWADGFIAVTIPELTGVTAFTANIFVSIGADRSSSAAEYRSNLVPFNFIPRQQARIITKVTDDHNINPIGGFTRNDEIHHTRLVEGFVPFFQGNLFFGRKSGDAFFLKSKLKNGWKVDCIEIIPYDFRGCSTVGSVAYTVPPGSGAYVEPGYQIGGERPTFGVTWWLEAFVPAMSYRYAVAISGPAGTPDGIEVP
jgi:hypothetical protein